MPEYPTKGTLDTSISIFLTIVNNITYPSTPAKGTDQYHHHNQ